LNLNEEETKVHVYAMKQKLKYMYTQSLYNRRLSEKQGKTSNCQLNITHMHEFWSPPLQVSGEWVAEVERSSLYKSQCTGP